MNSNNGSDKNCKENAMPMQTKIKFANPMARKNGICLANGVGVIDEDYRGEIGVVLYNAGGQPFVVENGMRIAQLVVMPRFPVQLVKVNQLDETERGEGGFGSTGVVVSTPKRCGKVFEQQLNEIWDEMLHRRKAHE